MLEATKAFYDAAASGKGAVVLVWITNAFGMRVFSDRWPSDELLGTRGPAIADGAWKADGARQAGAGALAVIGRGAKVLRVGRITETLTPRRGRLVASLVQEQAGTMSLELADTPGPTGRELARMEGQENLLGAKVEVVVGWPGLEAREFLSRFTGRVVGYQMDGQRVVLKVRAG